MTGNFTGGESDVVVTEAERLAHFIKHRHFVSSLKKGKRRVFDTLRCERSDLKTLTSQRTNRKQKPRLFPKPSKLTKSDLSMQVAFEKAVSNYLRKFKSVINLR